jgi:5-methylthioadenosine/S-adenosylhomocysteine deaminase
MVSFQDPTPVDTIIDARWIVPIEPADTVLDYHSLVVRGGTIVDLLGTEEAHNRYTAQEHVVLADHALIPGLINLHTHGAMTLLRGLADDLPLMEWLKNHIWPAENRHVSAQFVRDGTLLACAEMIRGGITCFNDMYFFPESSAEAALEAHMRAAIGMIVIDFPTAYAGDADDYLNKGLAIRDLHRDNTLLKFCMAPHAPYTVGDRTFEKILTYAEQLDMPIHIHLHETRDEIEHSLSQYHARPIQRLAGLGLLGPNLIGVHGVHLAPEELALLVLQGCHIAHCPSSNLKLSSGLAPVAEMIEGGINVGIGTDGAASNNKLDMFGEMRLAALLAKGVSGNAAAVPAHVALRMATLNGARALGMQDAIGSIEKGKSADITAIDLSTPETSPCYDVISHLVYAVGREQVTDVWIGGRRVLAARQLATLDAGSLQARTAYWRGKIGR